MTRKELIEKETQIRSEIQKLNDELRETIDNINILSNLPSSFGDEIAKSIQDLLDYRYPEYGFKAARTSPFGTQFLWIEIR